MGQPQNGGDLDPSGRERRLPPRYAALASHYLFEPLFCMPARGNEKPDAEGTVKAVQRRFATPVPQVANLDDLNRFFRQRCQAERERVVQSLFGPFPIQDRLAEDLAAAAPLPNHRFDPCVIHPAVAVDKYQTVAFDTNRYSVPRPFAFRMVTVKGYVDRVVIAAECQIVATHLRCSDKHTMVRADSLSGGPGPSPVPWITRRSSATGSFPRASPTSVPSWSSTTAPRPAPASSPGSCSCWANTP